MITAFAAWLLADFISGVTHWFEDRVLSQSRIPFFNSIIEANRIHHKMPGFFLRFSYWENISSTVAIAWPLAGALFFLGAPTVVWLAMVFGGFANIVHRFAHTPKGKRALVVRFLQAIGFLNSAYQHSRHHFVSGRLVGRAEASRCYCAMTSWLNPTLDAIGFWDGLEWFFNMKR